MDLTLRSAVKVRTLSGAISCSAIFDHASGQTLLLNGRISALANLLALKQSLTCAQASAALELDQEALESLVHELAHHGIVDL